MPCDNCHCQFTVFSRKHICSKCKRHFCAVCLKGSRKPIICELCQIFARRPVLRDKLVHMRTKDLIFYLQSEHIPVIGCVEKEDLIELILQHTHDLSDDNNSRCSQQNGPIPTASEQSNSTPLETIKQTCHNFFSNLSENMSDLYTKTRTDKRPTSVTEQPRISVRKIPTYDGTPNTNATLPGSNDISSNNNLLITTTKAKEYKEPSTFGNPQESSRLITNDEIDQIITASTSAGSTYSKLTLNVSCDDQIRYDDNEDDDDDDDDDYSLSSCNELGAIGGITDESKIAVATNDVAGNSLTQPTPLHAKKLSRSHSENLYLNKRSSKETITTREQKNTFQHDKASKSCTRCAKNKTNIRQQVEIMRKHLESAQMSETDIKQELSKFLSFLEQRTKSIEYSHSESDISSIAGELTTNERLCLYPALLSNDPISRFINLRRFESVQQLKNLTVKELKQILMLNRVNFTGCCEKKELLDRVELLWKNLKSTPAAVDKLPSGELCKVCMDAPIECVILECGHMATCTNCGKVLCECPICRQYIVRVVRFFRA